MTIPKEGTTMDRITEKELLAFEKYLREEEKSDATVDKYLRDVRCFYAFLGHKPADKSEIFAYKEQLTQQYAPASVNSMLVALNCFLRFCGLPGCCVKLLKIQRQMFCRQEKELTQDEYRRLVNAAKDTQLSYILQTICGTGIRVSELQYITAEAVRDGKAVVNCKNKTRVIFIPAPLQKLLLRYIKKAGLQAGPVFVGRNGKPLDRSYIWRMMKGLCEKAGVARSKVFPHNLRHLFAKTFYSIEKDIVRLADLLGHSSVDTTRIYTIESGDGHLARLERVQRTLLVT